MNYAEIALIQRSISVVISDQSADINMNTTFYIIVAGIVVLAAILFFLLRKSKKKPKEEEETVPTEGTIESEAPTAEQAAESKPAPEELEEKIEEELEKTRPVEPTPPETGESETPEL